MKYQYPIITRGYYSFKTKWFSVRMIPACSCNGDGLLFATRDPNRRFMCEKCLNTAEREEPPFAIGAESGLKISINDVKNYLKEIFEMHKNNPLRVACLLLSRMI